MQDFGTREGKTSCLTEPRESVGEWVSQIVLHRTMFSSNVLPLDEGADQADSSHDRGNTVLTLENFCETATSD